MTEMTSHERFKRMFEHREADRVPITDHPWDGTIRRWRREGMGEGTAWEDYFGTDKVAGIGADNSPRYPVKVLEETDEYTVETTAFGIKMRNWRHSGGVPEFLDYTITDPDSWAEAKKRMRPDRDRIDWDFLSENYPKWREEGAWVTALLWFGYDITHSWAIGMRRMLEAMALRPEWVTDMFEHFLEVEIELFEMILDEGYEFDEVFWYDDMGYKGTTFFSLDMYRNLLRPYHRRAADWAHSKGAKVRLHSCGCVRPFIPDLIDVGVDMLNPIEVKAGMEPTELKAEFGDRLGFHGGLNAVYFEKPEKLWDEMRRVVPVMKEGGGYLASSDHSVPDNVSHDEFAEFVRLAKELGSYE